MQDDVEAPALARVLEVVGGQGDGVGLHRAVHVGAVGAGDLAMVMGSSTCHLAMSSQPLLGSGMLGCFPDAVVEGLYTLEGGQTATGAIIDWYRRHFAGNEVIEATKAGRKATGAREAGLLSEAR